MLDRMEIIELGSYSDEEKLMIAKNYLVPKQLKKHGLKKAQLRIISDTPGAEADNYSQYTDFWGTAPVHTFEILSDILSQL